ncbi:universal stress protein [Mesorhizobium sp. WSM4884]|uniref:universal stress protein n=1 Tax=Mesorhizobium sp. WSM4884 TaxID=3038542 RepID=UPI0024176009|nr:universal stress protein [Mesorhizobium sp. WSM4884]MDG4884475.1 universal stress protein [Mesorhizobium sp. WSM4884]
MSYKDILIFLDGSTDSNARMEFAFSLAQAHGARLTGVDVDAAAAFEGEWAERAKSLAETFHAAANRSGVHVRFKIADRYAAGWKDFYAHYADLLIATQPNQEASGRVLSGVPEQVLMTAGVPMIMLPQGWKPRPVGKEVVIAWSPSAQATRVVHGAMPILARAQKVTAFAFDPPADGEDTDVELLREHLLAHGVRIKIDKWSNAGGLSPIEALFASPALEEADLVVAGAYSHSRFREALFGGMTKSLLQQFSLPVLVSH